MALTKKIYLLKDFAEGAKRRRANGRKTDRFSTGVPALDSYLGGGFGRNEGSEIVLLFGPTKVGKSRVALNFMRKAIADEKKVGLLVLEDDGEDVFNRFQDMFGGTKRLMGKNIYFTPPEHLEQPWKLVDLLKDIERLFVDEHLELILLDHLQFAFENAEAVKGENEYIAQRVFMRDLSQMMKKISKGKGNGKTMIIVSHVNKDGQAKGVGKIIGSSGIAAAATKIIGIERASLPKHLEITLWGSRHTETPDHSVLGVIDNNSVLFYSDAKLSSNNEQS